MKVTFYLNILSNNALFPKDEARASPQLPMEKFSSLLQFRKEHPLPLPNQFCSQDNSALYDSYHSPSVTIILYCFKKPRQSTSFSLLISPLIASYITLFCSSALQQHISWYRVFSKHCQGLVFRTAMEERWR